MGGNPRVYGGEFHADVGTVRTPHRGGDLATLRPHQEPRPTTVAHIRPGSDHRAANGTAGSGERQAARQDHGAGAHRLGEVVEENIFFDTPERSLLSIQSGLRLRINRDVSSDRQSIVLTFKGRAAAGELKMREEIEVVVNSAEHTIALLARLG